LPGTSPNIWGDPRSPELDARRGVSDGGDGQIGFVYGFCGEKGCAAIMPTAEKSDLVAPL
jgi:hypothetical protein